MTSTMRLIRWYHESEDPCLLHRVSLSALVPQARHHIEQINRERWLQTH